MTQIIDFSNMNYEEGALISMHPQDEAIDYNNIIVDYEKTYSDNGTMLKEMYPDKILFSVREVSSIVNVSYEFIRNALIKKRIIAVNIGSRKMINIKELCRIITEGV